MGPQLFAYVAVDREVDVPAAPQTRLEEITLLAYAKSDETEDIERCLDGYQHADEWGGGAWLTTADSSAVMFAGTKATGARYWYGYVNPAGPEFPCVEEELIGSYALCRLADGTPVPDEESLTCESPISLRGWWSARFDARFIFYDPADLARVATGEMEPWEPQPYAYLDIDEELFLSPGIEARDARHRGSAPLPDRGCSVRPRQRCRLRPRAVRRGCPTGRPRMACRVAVAG